MIYLDNAATSYPKPDKMQEMLTHYLTHLAGNPGRGGHIMSLAASEAVYRARCSVSEFIGCTNPENIIFAQNATFAINTIIRAKLKRGMHVLISDLEHNSVFRPIWKLAQDGIITYSIFSHRGDIIQNITSCIQQNTCMLICTHLSNVTGFEFPIERIAELCHEKGIYFIVDASQSIGHREIDVMRINCDALCAPGHKGLLGLQGSGFLYVRDKTGLRDVFQGGSGAHSLSPQMPEYLPDRFEAGTLSTPAILSLEVGISYLKDRSLNVIEREEQALSKRLHDLLCREPNIILHSEPKTGIVAFQIDGMESEVTASMLDECGICVRGGYHCSPLAHKALGTLKTGLVRASVGVFNTPGEIEIAAYHISRIAKKQGNV